MSRPIEKLLEDLAGAVVEMREDKAVELACEALESGVDPYVAIMDGLARGMETAGKKFEKGEYFIPQLMVSSDAMSAGLEILRPHIVGQSVKTLGRVVIGAVEGDVHDIGKNLVRTMLEASGFEIYDLGRDVPLRRFVEESKKWGAHMICMSTLMTNSMDGMEKVLAMLEAEGIRGKYKVMVGGGPVSQSYAERIGADGYAPNALAAVKKAKELLG